MNLVSDTIIYSILKNLNAWSDEVYLILLEIYRDFFISDLIEHKIAQNHSVEHDVKKFV